MVFQGTSKLSLALVVAFFGGATTQTPNVVVSAGLLNFKRFNNDSLHPNNLESQVVVCILTATRGGELFQDLISQLAGGKRVQDCRAHLAMHLTGYRAMLILLLLCSLSIELRLPNFCINFEF